MCQILNEVPDTQRSQDSRPITNGSQHESKIFCPEWQITSFAIVPGNLSGLDFSLGKSHCAWKRSCQSAPFQREEAELLVGFAAMVATYWSKKWNGPVAIRRPAAL